jgi:hypothetical protein
MPQKIDDLEAVRTIVATLETFPKEEQERILRWTREKLGLELTNPQQSASITQQHTTSPTFEQQSSPQSLVDLKTFVNSKKPATDRQFAATVAFYYKFEAPEKDRKDSINSAILQDATRLASRSRLKDPKQTLYNASFDGLLDKAEEKGFYRINTVGENLVAMTLPQNNPPTKKSKTLAKTKKNISKLEMSKKQ